MVEHLWIHMCIEITTQRNGMEGMAEEASGRYKEFSCNFISYYVIKYNK